MSGARLSYRMRICIPFVLALVLGAVAAPALHRKTRSVHRAAPSPGAVPTVIGNALSQPSADAAPSERQRNSDPDADEPRVGAEHRRLLEAEPLLQRLPYRDREIGLALSGLTGANKPQLLVTYTGAAVAARADLRALLVRLGDLGVEYAWRFRRLMDR